MERTTTTTSTSAWLAGVMREGTEFDVALAQFLRLPRRVVAGQGWKEQKAQTSNKTTSSVDSQKSISPKRSSTSQSSDHHKHRKLENEPTPLGKTYSFLEEERGITRARTKEIVPMPDPNTLVGVRSKDDIAGGGPRRVRIQVYWAGDKTWYTGELAYVKHWKTRVCFYDFERGEAYGDAETFRRIQAKSAWNGTNKVLNPSCFVVPKFLTLPTADNYVKKSCWWTSDPIPTSPKPMEFIHAYILDHDPTDPLHPWWLVVSDEIEAHDWLAKWAWIAIVPCTRCQTLYGFSFMETGHVPPRSEIVDGICRSCRKKIANGDVITSAAPSPTNTWGYKLSDDDDDNNSGSEGEEE